MMGCPKDTSNFELISKIVVAWKCEGDRTSNEG